MARIKIEGAWHDQLWGCPHQCELDISSLITGKFTRRYYILYIRWRWDDPWTADLIELDKNRYMQDKYDPYKDGIWHKLTIPFFREEEIDKVKTEATKVAFEYIKTHFL